MKYIRKFLPVFFLSVVLIIEISTTQSDPINSRDGKLLKIFQTLLSMGNSAGVDTKVHSSSDYYKQYSTNNNANTNNFNGLTSNSPFGTNNGIGSTLSKLGLFGDEFDLAGLMELVNFGVVENMLGKVNSFDQLRCIPRMICQMVAKRKEESQTEPEISSTTSTTTTTTSTTEKSDEKSRRNGRFIKIHGVDTALSQFVR